MMNQYQIAAILEEIADLLDFQRENPFKVQAYRSAAKRLKELGEDFDLLMSEGRLREIQGIGAKLAEKITELYTTGKLPFYTKLKEGRPSDLRALLSIPGLGAKKVQILFDQLRINSISELEKACKEGKVAELPGFGPTTESNILHGIQNFQIYRQRHLLWDALRAAQPILKQLKKLPQVEQAIIAGSLRRKVETVHDIDFLVASSDPEPVMDWFTTERFAAHVSAKGKTRSSIRLQDGIQADLRVVPKENFPYASIYFTGSKEHNIRLRGRAHEFGYKLNEWDLEGCPKKARTEKELYRLLKLDYIPPELREDMGEIEAAEKGTLPKLIEEKDIRGVFHVHTLDSDGRNTLEEMAQGAQEMGWEYIGISDHSKSSTQANGLSEEKLIAQVEQIRKLNRSKKFQPAIFAGIECDILKNGDLDYDEAILKELDYVIVSIHRGFKMPEEEMTKRLIRAIENPYTTMVGHLTGRLLLRRESYALNIPKVIDAAIANGVIIEINANPRRLDMDWRYWCKVRKKGLLTCINPDAHTKETLIFFRAGLDTARKGWLESEDVLNTRSLAQVTAYLKERTGWAK